MADTEPSVLTDAVADHFTALGIVLERLAGPPADTGRVVYLGLNVASRKGSMAVGHR